jgi:hypothetical protein
MILFGDHIHGHLDGRVQHFRDQDKDNGQGQQDEFRPGDVHHETQQEHTESGGKMIPHMLLRFDGVDDAFDGDVRLV